MGVAVGDAQVAGGGEVAAAFDHSWIVARDHPSGAAPKGRKASLHHSYTLPLMSKRLPPLELRVPSQLWGFPLEFAANHATDAGSSLPAYLYFCCLRLARAALPPPRHLRQSLLADYTHRLRSL